MWLDLKTIVGDVSREERRYPPAAFDTAADEFQVAGEVWLRFEIHRKDTEYRLAGSLRAPLELACGRCLEPFAWVVEVPFDLRYRPQAENLGEGEREVDEADLGLAYYRDEVIDLGQLVREQCYLALPMKPLCSDTCRGLCPTCGTNLNTGACECRAEWVDPRLAALKPLLDRSSKR